MSFTQSKINKISKNVEAEATKQRGIFENLNV